MSDRISHDELWRDPDRTFLGEQSQGGMGNHAGPELAFMRLLSWWLHRRARVVGAVIPTSQKMSPLRTTEEDPPGTT